MKAAIYIGTGIGGILGAYVPVWLWQADPLDLASLLGGLVGTIIGLWGGYKVAKLIEG